MFDGWKRSEEKQTSRSHRNNNEGANDCRDYTLLILFKGWML